MPDDLTPQKPQDRTRAILRSTLEMEATLIAIAIADHMDADGEAWPCVATIAAETRIGERTVRDVITHGLDTGWLAARWRPGRIRVLRIVWERLADTDRPARTPGVRKPSHDSDPARGAGSIRHGAPEGPETDPARGAGSIRHGAPVDPARGAGSIRHGAPMKQTSEATMKQTSEATTMIARAPEAPSAGEIPNPEKWAALFPTTATEAPPAPTKPKLQDRLDLAIRTVYEAYRLTHPKKSPTVSPQDRKAIKAMLDECGGTTAAALDEATKDAVLMIEWVAQSQDERARQVRGEAPWPKGDLTKRDELPSLGSNAGSRVEMVRAWNARGRCDAPPVFRPTPSPRPNAPTPFVSIADMIASRQSTQPPTRTGVVIDIEEPN